MKIGFWFRWTLRDLRARWLQVTVIALIIAVGTGVYAGLGSTARWRRLSNDASYEVAGMHDLRVQLVEGGAVPEGTLLDALRGIEDMEVAQERLLVPVQIDASVRDETILVPGRLISYQIDGDIDTPFVTGGGNAIDGLLLEGNFADHYDLADSGRVRLGGGSTFEYSGVALAPEYFMVMTEEGGMMAQANFAALFAPLRTVQELTGFDGLVNDLVLRVRPGADIAAVRSDIERRLARALPEVGTTVLRARDDVVYRVLYDDIENDQKFWTVFALLIFAGAAFAAFNLTSRMVEAQRRQIGIGMAIGVSPRMLALRPLLVAFEIAVLGVGFGIFIGLGVGAGLRALFVTMMPLPIWKTPFQPAMFARAAALGLILPFAAAAWPVWRAVRVAPVDAIRTAHLAAKTGLAPLLKRLPLPKHTTVQMPLSNVARAPRRTVFTALGIAAAITALVATFGMLDSFIDTIEAGESEQLKIVPNRMTVELDEFQPITSDTLAAIQGAASVERTEPSLHVTGRLLGKEDVDVRVQFIDLDSGLWHPTIVQGTVEDPDGIVLSEEAAADLGIGVGDQVRLEHPVREGRFSFSMTESTLDVIALHPNPLRAEAFIDTSRAGLMGLSGFANAVQIDPRGSSVDVKRELFAVPGVVSVQPVAVMAQLYRDVVREFLDILRFIQLFVLILALLIAFNATSINLDERARENATMFAFGMRLRTVMRMTVMEGMAVGIIGTLVGLVAGFAFVSWMVGVLIEDTMPELGMRVTLTGNTIGMAFMLGAIAVALAPLFAARKLRRMDIPSTLRVVE